MSFTSLDQCSRCTHAASGPYSKLGSWHLLALSSSMNYFVSPNLSFHQQTLGDNRYPIKLWRGSSKIVCVMTCLAQHLAQSNTYSVHGGEDAVMK